MGSGNGGTSNHLIGDGKGTEHTRGGGGRERFIKINNTSSPRSNLSGGKEGEEALLRLSSPGLFSQKEKTGPAKCEDFQPAISRRPGNRTRRQQGVELWLIP